MACFAVKRKVRLVAEGIETVAEFETLRSLAMHYGQGYLLGRPRDGRADGPWPTKITLEGSWWQNGVSGDIQSGLEETLVSVRTV